MKKYGRTVLALLLCINTFFVPATVYARGWKDITLPDESAALSDSMLRIEISMAAEAEVDESTETKTEGTEAEARAVPASSDTGSYTDNHGITYKYYLHDGDKLNIYEITGYEGDKKLMSIPMEISSYKVTQITACLSYGAELASLTIPDTVTYVGEGAFSGVKIDVLYYNAEKASTTENFSTAPFASAEIHELHIGDYVTEIPDFMFSNAIFGFNEFTLDVKRVGKYAFYGTWKETREDNKPYNMKLTITDSVDYIGACAFANNDISTLKLGTNVRTGASDTDTGVFYAAKIGSLEIGENVTEIPDFMFSNAYLTQDEIDLKVSRIGRCAFYNCITVTDLTIGEGVKEIGNNAFHSAKITNLHYNAVNATVGGDAAVRAADGPFYGITLSGISFGAKVESIPRCLFSHAKFSVESLGLPDSVTSIGTMAFYSLSSGDITIRELVIGENISYIGASTFTHCTIEQAVVYAVKADNDFKGLSFTSDELPVCASVEIHRGSDFYRYFTDRIPADSVTPMCKTFETVYGEEYYDDESHSFITPYEEDCVVCGYGTEGKNSVAAFTVSFLDHDGSVLKIQHVKYGEAAVPPSDPQKEPDGEYSYIFTGWDGDYSYITGDVTIHAKFEKEKLPPGGPGDDGEDPDDDKPGTGGGDTKPEDGGKQPGAGDTKPGDNTGAGDGGSKEPDNDTESDNGSKEPDNDTESGDSGRKPGNDTEPGTEEPGNGQTSDAGTTANPPAPGTETGRPPESQATDTGKPDAETTQTGTEDTDNAGNTETTLQDKEDAEDSFLWLVFAALAVLFLIWLLLLLLLSLCYGEKICGTVWKCGEPVNGLHIILERSDKKNRYEILTVNTDKDGAFCFSGLQKDSYRLGFFDMAGQSAFSMDIHMGGKEENIFTVPATCHGVKTEKKGRKYVVDVEA